MDLGRSLFPEALMPAPASATLVPDVSQCVAPGSEAVVVLLSGPGASPHAKTDGVVCPLCGGLEDGNIPPPESSPPVVPFPGAASGGSPLMVIPISQGSGGSLSAPAKTQGAQSDFELIVVDNRFASLENLGEEELLNPPPLTSCSNASSVGKGQPGKIWCRKEIPQ